MRKPIGGANEQHNSITSAKTTMKMRKGLWSPEEDERLMNYMITNGHGCWSDIARNAGLQRCGKSCRLRWINYLRPDLKRGAFSPQEEEVIIHLHSLLGNRYEPMINIILQMLSFCVNRHGYWILIISTFIYWSGLFPTQKTFTNNFNYKHIFL